MYIAKKIMTGSLHFIRHMFVCMCMCVGAESIICWCIIICSLKKRETCNETHTHDTADMNTCDVEFLMA